MEATILSALPLLVKEGRLTEEDKGKIKDSLVSGRTLDGLFLNDLCSALQAWVSRSEPLTVAPSTKATAGANPFGNTLADPKSYFGSTTTAASAPAPWLSAPPFSVGTAPAPVITTSPFGQLPATFFGQAAPAPDARPVPKTEFKILLLGDGGVGKTQLLRTLLDKPFETKYLPTIGVEVHPYTSPKYPGVRVNFWDVAGQEKFGGLRDGYFIQAHAAILVYENTSKVTFRNMHNWRRDALRVVDNLPMVVVANTKKADEKKAEISPEMEQNVLGPEPCPIFSASASLGPTMLEAVNHLLSILLGEPKDLQFERRAPKHTKDHYHCHNCWSGNPGQ